MQPAQRSLQSPRGLLAASIQHARRCSDWLPSSMANLRQLESAKLLRYPTKGSPEVLIPRSAWFLWAGEVVDCYGLKLRRWARAPIGVIRIDSHPTALGARIRGSRELRANAKKLKAHR